LNAEIDSCPPFPGKERHLLRATVARITHATEICPKGLYEIDEETQEIKPAEEYSLPGVDELKSLEVWAHRHPNILKAGRCSHTAPEGIAEDALEEFLAKQAEDDKVEERFRALNEDTPVVGSETAWISRVCGDTQGYSKGEGTVSYATNVIRSLRWPGAVTVSKSGAFCSIYVGDGIKRGDQSYSPVEPPEV
jgi:radial spoke head protein 4/6|tara:strand:- start:232 stop:810 length:579 start_codon:yes stop_codon:yes gene_type:complete